MLTNPMLISDKSALETTESISIHGYMPAISADGLIVAIAWNGARAYKRDNNYWADIGQAYPFPSDATIVTLSATGSRMAAGTPRLPSTTTASSSVHRNDNTGSLWQSEYTYTHTNNTTNQYPLILSDNGDVMVVGEPTTTNGTTYFGAVSIHTRSGTTWIKAQTITNPTTVNNSFGWSVDANPDCSVIVIGTRLATGTPILYTYIKNGAVWEYASQITPVIDAGGLATEDITNVRMSADGNHIVIYQNNTPYPKFLLFTKSVNTWVYDTTIDTNTPANIRLTGLYGYAVNTDCTKIFAKGAAPVVDQYGTRNLEALVVYKKQVGVWSMTKKFIKRGPSVQSVGSTGLDMTPDGSWMVSTDVVAQETPLFNES